MQSPTLANSEILTIYRTVQSCN